MLIPLQSIPIWPKLSLGSESPSAAQIRVGQQVVRQIAQRLGWTPVEAQAALWAANLKLIGKYDPNYRYERFLEQYRGELAELFAEDIGGARRGLQAAERIRERIRTTAGIPGGVSPEFGGPRPAGTLGPEALAGRGEEVRPELGQIPPPGAPTQRVVLGAPARGPAAAPAPVAAPAVAGFGPSVKGFDLERLFLGAAQVFEKHPGLEKLGAAVRKHVDLRRAYEGRFSNPFRVWHKKYGTSKEALKGARDYWEAEDSGRAADAAAIRAKATPGGQELIDTATKVLNDAFDLADKIGYKVKDPKTGRYHPFKKGAHIFPRMVKQSVIDTFRNSNGVGKAYRELKDQLINSGAISAANADADMLALRDKVNDLVKGNDVMANVDLMRSVQLPTELYDYGFPAIRRFVSAFSESLARRQSIGEKGSDVFDYTIKRAGDEATKNYLKAIQANAYNEREHSPVMRYAAVANEIATPLHLANPRSVLNEICSPG